MQGNYTLLFVEPFYGGSHKSWLDSLCKFSSHNIEVLTLPGTYWKWRMQGGAVELANQYKALNKQFDAIIVSDMLNLPLFKALANIPAEMPIGIYFHENQLTYPWSPDDRDVINNRENHYAFINYTSCLAADKVYFNSDFHKENFNASLIPFLKAFPDKRGLEALDQIRNKSKTLPLGLNLQDSSSSQKKVPKSLLWNHRWEHDKNPEEFYRLCQRLEEDKEDFSLILLGERVGSKKSFLEEIAQRFEVHVLYNGYCSSREEYISWVQKSSILPVSSLHDFFGISVAEAIFYGVEPILPRRMNYPNLLPIDIADGYLYDGFEELVTRVKKSLSQKVEVDSRLIAHISRYSWENLIRIYDEEVRALVLLRK